MNPESLKNLDPSKLDGLLSYRYSMALTLRQAGLTYKQIGIELGVCLERARQMVYKASQRLTAQEREWPEISVRAQNCLIKAGYNTKEEIIAAIKSKKLNHKSKWFEDNHLANYGPKTYKEVCAWLEIEP